MFYHRETEASQKWTALVLHLKQISSSLLNLLYLFDWLAHYGSILYVTLKEINGG